MKILVCNAGSTSLKFKLWQMPEKRELAGGRVERVGYDNAVFQYRSGEYSVHREPIAIPDYACGIRMFLEELTSGAGSAIDDVSEIEAVGFKTVLSKGFPGVHELTEEVLSGMRAYLSVAPAHNTAYLSAIETVRAALPKARMIGVFETAFHQTIPLSHRMYPIPYEWYEKYGVMKMGYHGASHGYIAKRLSDYPRVISCHLGGSGSICAILNGQSIDNSFGFSLQAGVPHASRVGDADIYIIPFLLEQGLTIEEIYRELGKNGGLKGLSGTSGDLRDVEKAIAEGSARAKLALDVMVTNILRYIGAYYVELGGLDALTFTGGIGENSAHVREMVAKGLAFMGVQIDEYANSTQKPDGLISKPSSTVKIFVIPADEEYMVVDETYKFCLKQG